MSTLVVCSICGNCKTELPLVDGVQDVSATTLSKLIRNSERPLVVNFWAGAEVDRQSGAMPLPMLMEYLNRWK